MNKVRYIKIPARAASLNNTEQSDHIGFGTTAEWMGSGSNAEIGGIPHALQEPAPERPGDSSSARGRKLKLLVSALALVLVSSIVVWLFEARSSGTTGSAGEQAGTSYPITSAGADITGLGTGPKVGQLAPDFVLDDVHTGKPLRLSSLRGKPVWINFWASWCPPCKAELPDMKKEYARYKDKGLVLLGVDMGEDAAIVRQFTTSNGYNWDIGIDSNGHVTNMYYVFSIPTHIFVGSDGTIKSIQIGSMTQALMEDHLSKLIHQ